MSTPRRPCAEVEVRTDDRDSCALHGGEGIYTATGGAR